ncbi:MAG: Sua5/YciO/YrdC/YwlC family protein [Candidatus Saccharibacteria bacterium]|nr:Sua5/YciO/YrdC/YwlC family protein [Moraxellaceae bacterium]
MTIINERLDLAVSALRDGQVIAYPTEAVWGLGCDPWNEQAVLQILRLKQRPVEKGVILIASDIQQIEPFLERLTSDQRDMVIASWKDESAPATTWLVPLTAEVPKWISGEHQQVAVRVTKHLQTQALCRAFGRPIVSTSANPSGEPSALDSAMVRAYFGNQVFVLEGATGGATQPSVIRDVGTGTVLRG